MTTAQTLSASLTRTAPAHPARVLLDVMGWEIRRFFNNRALWWILPLTFGFFLFFIWLLWLTRFAGTIGFGNGAIFNVSVTSAQGLVMILPTFSFLLALIVPFVTTDGITRDLKQRTHELLMTTPLPTWAYIWGRYLVCLLLGLGLAVLLLAALLLMGGILHLTQTNYLLPQPTSVVLIWAVGLAPTSVLISSVSFGLGTIAQRHSNLVKIGILLGWSVCTLVLPSIPAAGSRRVPSWYLTWEPTNIGMTALLQAPYAQGTSLILNSAASGASDHATLSALTNLEQQMPDLGIEVLPHLLWVVLGLLVVVFAALVFNRFRNAIA